jgi:hypothetical protein
VNLNVLASLSFDMASERQEYGRALLEAIEEEGVSIEGVSTDRLDEWTILALETRLLGTAIDVERIATGVSADGGNA